MSPVGFALLLCAVAPATPPGVPSAEPLALCGPRLARGDELVYAGEVLETGDRVDNRFKKRYELEVRVFVLDVYRNGADCGVLTAVRPMDDPLVTRTEAQRGRAAPAVRLDLVRVDDRGRVKALAPKPGPPPLPLDKDTPTADPPLLPADAPPLAELGAFVPLPVAAVKVGGTWDATEPNRPPVVWSAKGEAVWNGRRCVEANAVQQTDGYDRPDAVRAGWKRTDAVLVSPADGVAASVVRTFTRREGRDAVGTVTVRYELQPSNKLAGAKYQEARAEVEAAWAFAADHADGVMRRAKPDEVRARLSAIDRHLADRPASDYRAAVEAVKRRYEAGTTGTAPPVATKKIVLTPVAEPPKVGQPAPDFAAPDVDKPTGRVRLSAARGKPVVVAFFKPGSETSQDTLTICEALHRKYAGTITVLPLAIHAPAADAAKQRAELKCTVPVYDGAEVRAGYAVESFPRFYVIDGKGTLRWAFDAGVGPEVGFLVKQEVEKVK